MRRLFPLLLLSLPLLLLYGLADAQKLTSPTSCRDEKKAEQHCTDQEPYCKLEIRVNPKTVDYHNSAGWRVIGGCASAEKHGCVLQEGTVTNYLCFCDSRILQHCSEDLHVYENLAERARELYIMAHSVPPRTPDLKNYCLGGSSPLACNASSFCHSKIFFDPVSRYPAKYTGHGCVVKRPENSPIDGCRQTEYFTLSAPVFDCFCPSEMGHVCNNLDSAMNFNRREDWFRGSSKLLKEAEEARTTTANPKYYCLKGSSTIACPVSSFCHSKLFLDPSSRYQNDHAGFGCLDKLPEESLHDGCRKVEPFSINNPKFECFCPSVIGYSCNDLDKAINMKRRDIWYRTSIDMLTQFEEAQAKTPPPTTNTPITTPPTTTADPSTTSGSFNSRFLGSLSGTVLLLLAGPASSLPFSPPE